MSQTCVVYCRVSSIEQKEEGTSLITQKARCESYAQAQGWTVIAVEQEQHSGADYAGRRGLQRALKLIEDGNATVLLAYATDRLSREQMHVGVILDRVLRAGGSLQFVTEDFENSATGKLLLQVRTFAAELEREKIAERTTRGRVARTASGKYLPGQKAPYGFRWAPDTDRHGKLLKAQLIDDPETAPVVRRIFREIAAGGSARMMASHLNREGVPTPTQRGAYWYPKTISDIIWHPVYIGQAVAWRWHRDGTRAVLRPPSEVVALPNAAPALVSPDVAAAAQARLLRNRQEATRNNKNPEDALLRAGFARCGYCGRSLTMARHNKTGQPYYRCTPLNRDRCGCPSFGIVCRTLDTAVWDRVAAILRDPQTIAREVEQLRDADTEADEEATTTKRIAEVERRRSNLARSIAALDDAETSAPLLAELQTLSNRHKELLAERDALVAQRLSRMQAQLRMDSLARWCETVAANLDAIDYEGKRMALDALSVRATVWRADHQPRYAISLSVPLGNDIADSFSR
jgi:site-specific DNA recombinase